MIVMGKVKLNMGTKIRKLRKAKGLSLKEVSKKVDLSTSLLSQIENDKVTPSIATLFKIANFLGKKTSFFLDDYTEDEETEVEVEDENNEENYNFEEEDGNEEEETFNFDDEEMIEEEEDFPIIGFSEELTDEVTDSLDDEDMELEEEEKPVEVKESTKRYKSIFS
jgi:transcriptional regulator with XRE-family HTH domain